MERACGKCGVVSDNDMRFCTKCGEPYPVGETKDADEEDSAFEEEEQDEGAGDGRLRKVKLKEKKWKIINTSSTLIAGAQGKKDAVASNVKKLLDAVAAPNLRVEFRNVRLAGLTAMFAGSRRQLVIENRKMRGYHVFVSIEDYGKQLNVSWYLMLKGNWLTNLLQLSAVSAWAALLLFPIVFVAKIFYGSRGYTIPELMNMFDIEELTAYTTTVHQAVKESIDALVKENNLNPAKVSTHTRGFLNLS